MDAVRRYIERYGMDGVVVIGGAAAYVWIKEYLGIEIPLHDIDVHITTSLTNRDIIQRWLYLLPRYRAVEPISSITTLEPRDSRGHTTYDLFINEMPDMPYTVIDGLPVETLNEVIDDHVYTIEGLTSDIDYARDSEELDWFLSKRSRMVYRLALLQTIPRME